ncbi:hypothetical protein OEZ86_006398 [Tetradesmus obliquus]|nr:hypothetical protein OEZ86_006398 [Tetradesmus obliquus]
MHQHFWPGLFILLVTLIEAASERSSTGTAEYNHARYSGGAAEIAGAAGLNLVTILNSSFVNNSAPNGGAIALKEDADLSIAAGSRLAGNHATSAGGAVQLQGTARLQVSGSALENNTAAEGGAVAALEAS